MLDFVVSPARLGLFVALLNILGSVAEHNFSSVPKSISSNVLITGVTGFLGAHVAHKLSQEYNVIGLDYIFDGTEDTRLKLLRHDVLLSNVTEFYDDNCDAELLARLGAQYSFKYVFLLGDHDNCSCVTPLLSPTPTSSGSFYVYHVSEHFSQFQACLNPSQKHLQVVNIHLDQRRLLGPYQWPYVQRDSSSDSQHIGPDVIYNNLTGGWSNIWGLVHV